MKRVLLTLTLLAATSGLFADNLHLTTPNTSLVLKAEKGGSLQYAYFGARLDGADVEALDAAGFAAPDAYPAYGQDNIALDALAVTHPNGDMTLDLAVDGWTLRDIHEDADGLHAASDATLLAVTLRDKVYPFTLEGVRAAHLDYEKGPNKGKRIIEF